VGGEDLDDDDNFEVDKEESEDDEDVDEEESDDEEDVDDEQSVEYPTSEDDADIGAEMGNYMQVEHMVEEVDAFGLQLDAIAGWGDEDIERGANGGSQEYESDSDGGSEYEHELLDCLGSPTPDTVDPSTLFGPEPLTPQGALDVDDASLVLPDLDSPSIRVDIDRFEDRICSLVSFITAWCRQIGSLAQFNKLKGPRPITRDIFEEVLAADPASLIRSILSSFSDQVKAVLGRTNLTLKDLLLLPRDRLDCLDLGVYASLATRLLPADTDQTSLTIISNSGKVHEARLYVGSATSVVSRPGLVGRITQHRSTIGGIRSGRTGPQYRRTRHYAFASAPGVISTFFALARLPRQDPTSPVLAFQIEGLMQAFFNVVVGWRGVGNFGSPLSLDLIMKMRASVPGSLPDFQDAGLNSTWCLTQCMPSSCQNRRDISYTTAYYDRGPCVLCSRQRDVNPTQFQGEGETSLCRYCAVAVRAWEKSGKSVSIEEEAAKRCGCANCGASEWWEKKRSNRSSFHGSGVDRRCNACFFYRLQDGLERPQHLW
jgi:hypothetical protein